MVQTLNSGLVATNHHQNLESKRCVQIRLSLPNKSYVAYFGTSLAYFNIPLRFNSMVLHSFTQRNKTLVQGKLFSAHLTSVLLDCFPSLYESENKMTLRIHMESVLLFKEVENINLTSTRHFVSFKS